MRYAAVIVVAGAIATMASEVRAQDSMIVEVPLDTLSEEAPAPIIEYDMAILQGLKKVTAETSIIRAPLNVPVQFGSLLITLKKCIKSAPEERPENQGLLLIQTIPISESDNIAFSGWMFSSSPAISALEHPVYDITMLECTMQDDTSAPEEKISDDLPQSPE